MGLLKTDLKKTKSPGTSLDVVNVKAKAGKLGGGQKGFEGEANLIKFGPNYKDGKVRVDGGLFNASAASTIGKKGAKLEASASIMQGAIRVGDVNPNETDTQVRLGAGIGVGGRLEIHNDDTDGDGLKETGFGFEAEFVGAVSVDIKSELPHKMQNALDSAIDSFGEKTGIKQAIIGYAQGQSNVQSKLTPPAPVTVQLQLQCIEPKTPTPYKPTAPDALELQNFLSSLKK